ncbi:MAG TPA: type I polyketide synthase, partial [Myxococcota bacterium]|nr:type I polyketide synthase [Myxococcota bacterium]
KKLSDAVRDGDRVLAVVRGTAVNHDGRSNGLTAPNALAQQALVRDALDAANLSPNDVHYVEAHGTGTPLGDPTELQALRAALTDETPRETPLVVGSVKTNIGHTEAAAGLAGLMKVVLAMQHDEIPKHLHFENLNPHIPTAGLPIQVPARALPWPRGAKPRVAGVSAFGFSGTNAHVVLQEAPLPPAERVTVERPLHVAAVSARSPEALRRVAQRLGERLRDSTEDLGNVCYTANAGRAHFEHRAAMVVGSTAELREKLAVIADGGVPAAAQVGQIVSGSDRPRVAFLFSGQASLYRDAGRDLYETQPTFRRDLDRCAEILATKLDVPLLDILFPKTEAQAGLILETRYGQPALIAFELALAGLWRSFGVEPDAVLGHSIGEYAACCVADAMRLEDVLPLVTTRGALMQRVAEGRMVSVTADEATVRELLRGQHEGLAVAAINGPKSIVVAGPVAGVVAFAADLERKHIKSKMLDSTRAFHSSMLDPMLESFEVEAGRVEVEQPRIPVVSNLTGQMYWRRKDELPNGGYWKRHAREAVQFAAGVKTLVDHGCTIFIEIGPRATLLGPASECVDRPDLAWLPSLRRSAGAWEQLLESVASAYARGVEVDWQRFDADYSRRRVALPTYPFERQRFWVDPPNMSGEKSPQSGSAHPLLGQRTDSPLGIVQFDVELGGRNLGYLADHRVQDKIILPAAGSLEMAVAAAEAAGGKRRWVLENIRFVKAVVLSESQTRPLQMVFSAPVGDSREFQIFSRPSDLRVWEGGAWTLHAAGKVAPATGEDETVEPLASLRARITRRVEASQHYATMTAMGLKYGPAFQAVTESFHDEERGEVLVRIAERADELAAEPHVLHPAVLDAVFQAFSAAGDKRIASSGSFMPINIERLTVYRGLRGPAWGFARVRQGGTAAGSRILLGDVFLFDDSGALVASASGMRSLRVEELVIDDALREPRELIHDVVWRRLPPASAQVGSQRWLVFCDHGGIGDALADLLEQRGHRCVRVSTGERFAPTRNGFELRVAEADDYAALVQATAHGSEPLHGVVHLASLDASLANSQEAPLDLEA